MLTNSIINSPNINKVKRIPQIKVFNKTLGELTTISHERQFYDTELKNKYGKVLARETFSIKDKDSMSFGYTIEVEPEYRQKGYNLGEILRLSSIIMILENKIKEFQIYSKNSALFFHSKYKFSPRIETTEEADNILSSVINNCNNKYPDIKKDAFDLLIEIRRNQNKHFVPLLCNQANDLVKYYMSTVLKTKDEYKSHNFHSGFMMALTDKDIYQDKDFFNNLFKKHNIDYKIWD